MSGSPSHAPEQIAQTTEIEEEVNLELRPQHERSLQHRLRITRVLLSGCLVATLLLALGWQGFGRGFHHVSISWFNNNKSHNSSGSNSNSDENSEQQFGARDPKSWEEHYHQSGKNPLSEGQDTHTHDDDAWDSRSDDEFNKEILITAHSPASRRPTPPPTTFSPTPAPIPIPFVRICTPPIPSSVRDGDGVTILDRIQLMPDNHNNHGVGDGGISSLILGGRGGVLAAGFQTYSRPRSSASAGEKAGFSVGLVRAFAYSCEHEAYRQLGSDLSPQHPEAVGDRFGAVMVGTADGRVLAIGANVEEALYWARTGGDARLKPYVEVYRLVDDGSTQRWEQLGGRITEWLAPRKGSDAKAMAGLALSEDGSAVALFDQDGAYGCGHTGSNCRVRVLQYGESHEEDGNVGKNNLRRTKLSANSWLQLGDPIPIPTWPEQAIRGVGGSLPLLDLAGNSNSSQLILSLKHPIVGTFRYGYDSGLGQWKKIEELKVQVPPYFDSAEWFGIESMGGGAGPRGGILSFTAEVEESDSEPGVSGGAQHAAVITDLSAIEAKDMIVYSMSFLDWQVKVDTAVSRDGNVAAVLPSRSSISNGNWEESTTNEAFRRNGDLKIFSKRHSCRSRKSDARVLTEGLPQMYAGKWSIDSGANNTCWSAFEESLQVSGHWGTRDNLYVWLSNDGKIVTAGNAFLISLYHIHFPPELSGEGEEDSHTEVEDMGVSSEPDNISTENSAGKYSHMILSDVCPPFPNVTDAMHTGDLVVDLPGLDRHTLSVASSHDASIVAVGMHVLDNEDRGMVRVYAWSCHASRFVQLGRDLFGSSKFDGFGVSVDLSADGLLLCVGANQPLPGKGGYVEVYQYTTDHGWKLVGQRINAASENGYRIEVGKNVQISDDGSIVVFSGQTSPYREVSYFIGAVTLKEDMWAQIGDSIIDSRGADGAKVHLSLSGDGKTLGVVTGSISYEMSDSFAKVYDISLAKNSCSEHTIPKKEEDKEFLGYGVAVNHDGTRIVVAGTHASFGLERDIVIRIIEKGVTGEWIITQDIIANGKNGARSIRTVSAFDAKGTTFAIGANGYDKGDCSDWAIGALYVASTGNNTTNEPWDSFRMVKGKEDLDQLGSTLRLSEDGKLAIAGSRGGYLSFFAVGLK